MSVCSDVMKLGNSKPWPEAMTMITGQSKMSAQPLMQYFKPLIDWLEAENSKNNDIRGWPEYDWKPYMLNQTSTYVQHALTRFITTTEMHMHLQDMCMK